MSLRAHVNDVRVRRVNAYTRDLSRVGEADGAPRFAAVAGAPDTIAMRNITANRILARTDVNNVRIRLADADRANGTAEVFVGNACPGDSAVGRFENTAASRSEIVFVGTLARPCDRD